MEEKKEIANEFPELPKRERSMIEISGCRNDENVNSDYLAFFLREDEEHGLGRLFFDSLLELEVLDLNINDFQGKFEVNREVPTNKGNRIDIVIKSKSENWAIIIENKIYHYLGNDLQDYCDSINLKNGDETNRKGVILSLKEEHEKYNKNFTNITHKAIIEKVKKKLEQNITDCNPKYLPFINDFILNIENYYYHERKDIKQTYQDRLLFYLNKKEHKEDIIKDINSVLKRIINSCNFKNKTTNKTLWWLYYDKNKNFQIYYNTGDLLIQDRIIHLRFSIKEDLYEKCKENSNFIQYNEFGKKIDKHFRILYYQKIDYQEIPKDKFYVDFLNQQINIFVLKMNEIKQCIIKPYLDIVTEKLSNLGFECNNDNFEHQYFYYTKDDKYQNVRFYINNEKLLENHLLFTFEFSSKKDKSEYDNLINLGKIDKKVVNTDFLQLFLKNEKLVNKDFKEEIEKCIEEVQLKIFPLLK